MSCDSKITVSNIQSGLIQLSLIDFKRKSIDAKAKTNDTSRKRRKIEHTETKARKFKQSVKFYDNSLKITKSTKQHSCS